MIIKQLWEEYFPLIQNSNSIEVLAILEPLTAEEFQKIVNCKKTISVKAKPSYSIYEQLLILGAANVDKNKVAQAINEVSAHLQDTTNVDSVVYVPEFEPLSARTLSLPKILVSINEKVPYSNKLKELLKKDRARKASYAEKLEAAIIEFKYSYQKRVLNNLNNLILLPVDGDKLIRDANRALLVSSGDWRFSVTNKDLLLKLKELPVDTLLGTLQINGNVYKMAVSKLLPTPTLVGGDMYREVSKTEILELFGDKQIVKLPVTLLRYLGYDS